MPEPAASLTPARLAGIMLALDILLVLSGQVERDLVSIDDLREAELARQM